MENLLKKHMLTKLKKEYAYDVAVHKDKLNLDDEDELLSSLMILDFDRDITDHINNMANILGDESFSLIMAVLAKSYGQISGLYVNKYGNSGVMDKMFSVISEQSKREVLNDKE